MTLIVLGLSLFIVLLSSLFVFLAKRSKSEHLTFNRSRSKKQLVEKARSQFLAKDWIVTKNTSANIEVDLSVKIGTVAFEIVCLDPKLKHFLSEIQILERFENLARQRRIRKAYLIIITDNLQSTWFIKAAEARRLVLVDISQIDLITCIRDIVEFPPDTIHATTIRIIQTNPSACATLMYRYKESGSKANAILWGRKALESYEGYFVHHVLFLLLIESGDLGSAQQVGEQGLSFKPKDAYRFFLGFQKIAVLKNDNAAVIMWAERWIKAEPTNHLAYENLACVYEKQNNAPLADQAITKAMTLEPNDSTVLRKATQLALSANDLPTACARAEQWVSIAPNDVGAYEMLFDVLLKQARYEAAATVINDALTIYSDQPRLLRKASLVALQRGDVAGATQFAERWRVSTPGDAWAHDQLSILYLRAANYDKAKAANSKSLELDPTNSNFLRRAEQIQAKAS